MTHVNDFRSNNGNIGTCCEDRGAGRPSPVKLGPGRTTRSWRDRDPEKHFTGILSPGRFSQGRLGPRRLIRGRLSPGRLSPVRMRSWVQDDCLRNSSVRNDSAREHSVWANDSGTAQSGMNDSRGRIFSQAGNELVPR